MCHAVSFTVKSVKLSFPVVLQWPWILRRLASALVFCPCPTRLGHSQYPLPDGGDVIPMLEDQHLEPLRGFIEDLQRHGQAQQTASSWQCSEGREIGGIPYHLGTLRPVGCAGSCFSLQKGRFGVTF